MLHKTMFTPSMEFASIAAFSTERLRSFSVHNLVIHSRLTSGLNVRKTLNKILVKVLNKP